MTLKDVEDLLDAEVVAGRDSLGLEVMMAGCADSMADILFYGQSGMLLLTGLTNPHIVHTAQTLGIKAIVVVRGKHPPSETIQLAERLGIPLLLTDYLLYETVGRLYTRGLPACREKVGDGYGLP
ncbi:MAG TPA: DRTGG domain-containing protein [Syntrophorhabdaceae bacterium]